MQLCFFKDAFAVEVGTVGGIHILNKDFVLFGYNHAVETGNCGIGQYQIIGGSSSDGGLAAERKYFKIIGFYILQGNFGVNLLRNDFFFFIFIRFLSCRFIC